MKQFILIIFISLLAFSCSHHVHSSPEIKIPSCLSKKIEIFAKESCDKGPNVKEYTFQNKQVFVFNRDNCGNDMTAEVVDKDCVTLGYLGGFTGNFKINGEDFSNALLVKTVWEK